MKKIFLFIFLFTLSLLSGCGQLTNSSSTNDFEQLNKELIQYSKKFPEFKIKNDNIQNAEPAILYSYANTLYSQGKKDEAAFWFYVAQNRNRYLIRAQKKDQPVSDQLFLRYFQESGFIGNVMITDTKTVLQTTNPKYKSMNSIYDSATRTNIHKAASGLGQVINPYAYGNLDKLILQLEKVQAYEKAYPLLAENLVSEMNLKSPTELKEIAEDQLKVLEDAKIYISENKQKIRDQRSKNGLPNQ